MSFYLEDVRFSVMETRLILEPEAVKIAIDRIQDEQIEELEKCVEEMLESLESEEPEASYLKPDERFHQIIYEATQNVVLINMIKTLGQIVIHLPVGKKRSAVEHKDILEAIKSKDKEKASKLMTEHLCATRKNVLKEIHEKVISEKKAFEE